MSKVLVLGASPLPIENEMILGGPNIRTWQFVEPLLEDGHQICLLGFRILDSSKQKKIQIIEKKDYKNLIFYSISQEKLDEISYIQKIYDKFKPDCIFSISSFLPSYIAVQLKTEKPIWFDRGDLMAEAQIKAQVDNSDDYLYPFWKLEEMILQRGDIFSTVSLPQRFALIGRLGGQGRLNKYTIGYEFVHVVPCGIDKGSYKHTKNILRGKYLGTNDFVILWSGGYNTWADVDTLFIALEKVMAKNKKIKFVSTGGAIPGQNEVTYGHFLKLINDSKYKNRFIMLGWVKSEDLPNIYLESDLGINIDRSCYEVTLGSRHRILDWMKAGLPILTTNPSELTQLLDKERMAFTFPNNNAKYLTEIILKLSSKKKILSEYAQRAKHLVQNEFTYELTTKPFREWVKRPSQAPDTIQKSKKVKYFDNSYKEAMGNIEKEYIENLKSQIDNFKKQQYNLDTYIYNSDKDRENLKTHISNLETEREALKTQTSNLDKDRSNLRAQNTNLELTNVNLTQHAANLEQIRADLTKHIDRLNEQIFKLNNEREQFEAQVRELTENLNKIYNSKPYKIYKIIKRLWKSS